MARHPAKPKTGIKTMTKEQKLAAIKAANEQACKNLAIFASIKRIKRDQA